MSVVLDTTVLIDVLRGHAPAVDYLLALDEVPVCSEVSRVEVVRGLRSSERKPAEQLFGRLRWIGLDESIARTAGELGRGVRRSHAAIGVSDIIIAATAQRVGLHVATTNIRHFPMIKGLRPPYRD